MRSVERHSLGKWSLRLAHHGWPACILPVHPTQTSVTQTAMLQVPSKLPVASRQPNDGISDYSDVASTSPDQESHGQACIRSCKRPHMAATMVMDILHNSLVASSKDNNYCSCQTCTCICPSSPCSNTQVPAFRYCSQFLHSDCQHL